MSTAERSLPAVDAEAKLNLQRPPRSLWSDAWRRLRRNKLALISLVYIAFLTVVAFAAPLLAPFNPNVGSVTVNGSMRTVAWGGEVCQTGSLIQVRPTTTPANGGTGGTGAAAACKVDPLKTGSWDYPLGTDQNGRDNWSRLIYGTRVSLLVGFVPMISIVVIGAAVGLIAGYVGGTTDNVLMRITDVVYAFPDLLFFIIVMTTLRDTAIGKFWNGFLLLFLSLSIVNWVGVARLVRGQVLSLKEKEFVEAARAVGVRPWKIIVRHILPNSLGPVIVAAAFIVPGAIITEAVLSFLGVGITPDTRPTAPFPTSWGAMILDGKANMEYRPWLLIAPAVAIATVTMAFTFLGDGLRDAFDPREQI